MGMNRSVFTFLYKTMDGKLVSYVEPGGQILDMSVGDFQRNLIEGQIVYRGIGSVFKSVAIWDLLPFDTMLNLNTVIFPLYIDYAASITSPHFTIGKMLPRLKNSSLEERDSFAVKCVVRGGIRWYTIDELNRLLKDVTYHKGNKEVISRFLKDIDSKVYFSTPFEKDDYGLFFTAPVSCKALVSDEVQENWREGLSLYNLELCDAIGDRTLSKPTDGPAVLITALRTQGREFRIWYRKKGEFGDPARCVDAYLRDAAERMQKTPYRGQYEAIADELMTAVMTT